MYLTILLKKQNIINELHENTDLNKLYFKCEGPSEDVSLM